MPLGILSDTLFLFLNGDPYGIYGIQYANVQEAKLTKPKDLGVKKLITPPTSSLRREKL